MKRLIPFVLVMALAPTAFAGIKYSYSPSSSSSAPEGTAVLSTGEVGGTKFLREDGDGTSSWQTVSGGWAEGSNTMTFGDGASGNKTMTFNGEGTYGVDGTYSFTDDNVFQFTSAGITDTGSGYEPIISAIASNPGTNTGASIYALGEAGNAVQIGAAFSGYGFILAHDGTSDGGGLAFYRNSIYPADINSTSTSFRQSTGAFNGIANNTITFGDASYRFANMYSVLGNFSGNVTLGTSGSDESITFTDDNATAGITWSEAGNQMIFIAPPTQDGGGFTTGNYVFQASTNSGQTASRMFLRDNTAGRGLQLIGNNADAMVGIMHPSGGGALYFPGAVSAIYPATAATAATSDPAANNGGVDFGGSSNRWNNVYSEAGNFSEAVTLAGAMKMTPTASPPGSPASGDIYVDSTAAPDELCFYDGAAWQGISSGTDANCA